MEFKPLIGETLKLITLVGLNPFSDSLFNWIWQKLLICYLLLGLTDIWSVLLGTFNGLDSTMEVLMATSVSQVFMKNIFFVTNKVNLKLLINNTSKFWKGNLLYFKEEKENEKIFSVLKSVIMMFSALLVLIVVVYILKPVIFGGVNELPYVTNCSRFYSYNICYVYVSSGMALSIPVILGFDLFYISTMTNVICEFKLLKNYFPNIRINPNVRGTDNEAMEDLIKLIDHHNLILECVNIMKDVYRVPFLGIILSNMFGICFSLLVLTSSDATGSIKLLALMLAMYFLFHQLFLCTFGQFLADESVKIPFEIYKSQWYIKTQPELRKALVMVMRRANIPEILNAGGFIPVNFETFVKVLKSTFSFYTFIQVMYEE